MNKKIFLDLGTHYAEGLIQFINMLKIDRTWKIYSFEANPIVFKSYAAKHKWKKSKFDVTFLNKAVSSRNGTVTINVETPWHGRQDGEATTIISLDKWTAGERKNFKTQYEVESIDFSNFVNSASDNCEIYCKMDIEGAEFEVLEKMIIDKSILKIKKIWIEFHDHYFTNQDEYAKRKEAIIKYLDDNAVGYELWH